MSAIRNISKGFSTASWILLLIWLIRSFIGLGSYNLELAEGFLFFLLLARLTSTELRRGFTTAIASFFGRIAGFFVITWLFIIIGGALFGLTPTLTAYTTQALLAAIGVGIVAIIINNLRRTDTVKLSDAPIIASPGNMISDANISAAIAKESLLCPIKFRGRTYGYIGNGEVAVRLNTRAGEIKHAVHGAFALIGIGESGLAKPPDRRFATDTDAQHFGYKGLPEFLEKCASVYEGVEPQLRFNRSGVWPFVYAEESPEGEHVTLPFLDVERTSGGERVNIGGVVVTNEDRGRVEIGPLSISGGGGKTKRRFGRYTILGFNGEKIRIEARGTRVEMHAEDYLLTVDGDSTSLRRGDHSIALSENYASFNAPKIRAEVSQDGWASFRAEDVYCRVSGNGITFESRGTSKTLQNPETALNLYKKIADIVSQASLSITRNEEIDAGLADRFAEELRETMAKQSR